MSLDYTLRLAEHGRLSGELLVVGDYSRGDGMGVDMQANKLVLHTYIGDARLTTVADVAALAGKPAEPVPRRFKSHYPNTEARLIPLDFFIADYGYDPSRCFPDADIAEIGGGELARVYLSPTREKRKALGIVGLSSENLGVLSRLFIEYENAYAQGVIPSRMMWNIKRRMSLPVYWFLTRRIEKKRRHVESVAFKGKKGDARKLKKELDEMVENLNRKAGRATQSP